MNTLMLLQSWLLVLLTVQVPFSHAFGIIRRQTDESLIRTAGIKQSTTTGSSISSSSHTVHDCRRTASQSRLYSTKTTLSSSSSSIPYFLDSPNGKNSASSSSSSSSSVHVVLFGMGHLRIDDHGGLRAALLESSQNSSNDNDNNQSPVSVIPLLVWDHFQPFMTTNIETAQMVIAAVQDLSHQLQEKYQLPLWMVQNDSDAEQLFQQDAENSIMGNTARVVVHVCDLDPVDNEIHNKRKKSHHDSWWRCWDNDTKSQIEVLPWTCHLREEPWQKVSSAMLTDSYPMYEQTFLRSRQPLTPINALPSMNAATALPIKMDQSIVSTSVPTAQELLQTMGINTGNSNSPNTSTSESAKAGTTSASGLYGTHWGGVDVTTVGERQVLQTLDYFIQECQLDDTKYFQSATRDDSDDHKNANIPWIPQNTASLEHASISWMMMGKEKQNNAAQNLLPGEGITRYLLAPLWLGTISPRRLWHKAATAAGIAKWSPFSFSSSNASSMTSIQQLVEGREWHKLLAATNMRQHQKQYNNKNLQNDDNISTDGTLEYEYWRWHGFLCRYAKKTLKSKSSDTADPKKGLLLVHGFGASSSQWSRLVQNFVDSNQRASENDFHQILAPDLLGFGQSEKPPITFTQYLWSGMVGDFAKQVGIEQHGWHEFCIGGNSIGGYTSMSVAADDAVSSSSNDVLSSLGVAGTQRCSGLILFNTAGNIRSKEEIMATTAILREKTGAAATTVSSPPSVAQLTAKGTIPPCSPPPRAVTRILGNGLLAYLRPNIRQICKKVYPVNPTAVDDTLCTNILRDSLDPGAINVMISGSKLPIPRTANELLGSDFGGPSEDMKDQEGIFQGPVLVAQGILDPLNDAPGRAALLGDLRAGITVTPINGGHCPHDERPEECLQAILQWRSAQNGAAQKLAVASATSSTSAAGVSVLR